MKKKLLTMLAAILLAGTNAFAEAVEIDGIWYNLVSKAKMAEVTQPPHNKYTGAVNIPETVSYDGIDYTVTSIGKYAFNHCLDLTSVIIPNTVTSIGEYAFYNCSLTSIIIPNNVTGIGESAFESCELLTSVIISNSVTTIGRRAFSYCSSLTSITIPSSVTSIGEAAFACSGSLLSINVETGNVTYDSRNNCNAIIETATNTLIAGCQNTTIPNSVTIIEDNAFVRCENLTSITIPNSVTTIGCASFNKCTSLTSITIGSGVKLIGSKYLSISSMSFANCVNLTDVFCYAGNVPTTSGNDAFKDSYIEYATLHVPVASVGAYKTTEPWSGFGTIAPIYDEESSKPFPAGTYAKADLKRTFAEGWNTICLPFAIDNIEAAFGTGAKAYGFDDFADGELKFSQVTSLAAGTPYVIYVPAEITELIAFENIVVEESNTISSNIDKNGACFRGTYAPVAAGEWTKNNSTDNIYGITPDGKIRKAGPEASILGLRGYFDIPAGTEVKGFVFENDATGIKNLSNSPLKGEAIYNLTGQRLNKAQKGINIVNGKKVLY